MSDSSNELTTGGREATLINQARIDADRLAEHDVAALTGLSDVIADFPGYEVLGEIHRGAQGIVYRARHLGGGHDVAIKVLRGGPHAASRDAVRFDREIRALTRLRHPHIVEIRDSGTASGCLYFVMDYVEGSTLDEHIATQQPALLERLQMFAAICDAVHAAHLRGVIHRDLKPSNVRIDTTGQPRVLDFGLVKLLSEDPHSDTRTMTVTGHFVGSLQWTSPEQADSNGVDIDLRTDVYALGVLLFNMLTEALPYEVSGSLRHSIEVITQQPPRRPEEINRDIEPDLSTIILTCLQKDRERRYQSAAELAADIRRYARGEPIEARRDSAWSQVRKALYRNRAAAVVLASLLIATTSGLAAALLAWTDVSKERNLAVAAELDAETERDRARAAEARAAAERERAEQVTLFLQQMLAAVDPESDGRRELTVREVLDNAVARMSEEVRGHPEVAAALHESIGQAYARLGLLDEAEESYSAAVARRMEAAELQLEERTAREVDANARAFDVQRRLERKRLHDAEAFFERMLKSTPGPEQTRQTEVADALVQLGGVKRDQGRLEEAEELLRKALAVYEGALETDPQAATAMAGLGWVLADRGQTDEAEVLMREALETRIAEYGDRHLMVARSLSDLAWLKHRRGEFEEAEDLFTEARVLFDAQRGQHTRESADMTSSIASIRRALGDMEGAEALYRAALEQMSTMPSPPIERVSQLMDSLGWIVMEQDRFEEAHALFEQALAERKAQLGEQHPSTIMSLRSLSSLLARQQRFEEAEALLREVVARSAAVQGQDHSSTVQAQRELAGLLSRAGRHDEAARAFEQVLDQLRAAGQADCKRIAETQIRYGELLIRLGRLQDAERLARQAYEGCRQQSGDEHRHAAEASSLAGEVLTRMGRLPEAEQFLLEAHEQLRDQAAVSRAMRLTLHRLIELYTQMGDLEQAEAYRTQLHEAFGRPPD